MWPFVMFIIHNGDMIWYGMVWYRCRALKATLQRVYDELRGALKPFEIVMVSMDKDEKGYHSSMADAPWLAIPYADAESRVSLLFLIHSFHSFICYMLCKHSSVVEMYGMVWYGRCCV
jgi:hypothetical protein